MENKQYKPGEYTGLGDFYRKYRKGYSKEILKLLLVHTDILNKEEHLFVDVGAGTGIWTREVMESGVKNAISVEPNDDMRENGKIWVEGLNVDYRKGSGEETGLDNGIADWLTMASSFHWTNPEKSLPEFHKVLKKGGYITLIWNPLLKKGDKIQEDVEAIIHKIVPEFDRGSRAKDHWGEVLTSTGHFKDVIEMRMVNYVKIPVEEYITTWEAVNHLQAVAGPERFRQIIDEMKEYLKDKEFIDVPYLTKSWTAKRVD